MQNVQGFTRLIPVIVTGIKGNGKTKPPRQTARRFFLHHTQNMIKYDNCHTAIISNTINNG